MAKKKKNRRSSPRVAAAKAVSSTVKSTAKRKTSVRGNRSKAYFESAEYKALLNKTIPAKNRPTKSQSAITPEESFSLSRSKKESKKTIREIAKNAQLRAKAGIKSVATPSSMSPAQRKAVAALESEAATARMEDTNRRREEKSKAKEAWKEKKGKEEKNKASKKSKAASKNRATRLSGKDRTSFLREFTGSNYKK